uniref:Uncharacterized protein n=1 Tax=Heterorhabditis bacteriophora TaxID=37862 RepID=A0A1I7X5A4_HETBA
MLVHRVSDVLDVDINHIPSRYRNTTTGEVREQKNPYHRNPISDTDAASGSYAQHPLEVQASTDKDLSLATTAALPPKASVRVFNHILYRKA